jgi:hypothetical protein
LPVVAVVLNRRFKRNVVDAGANIGAKLAPSGEPRK